MGFAHHFPGLQMTVEQLADLATGDIDALYAAGQHVLAKAAEERFAHTKLIVAALGGRIS